MSILIKGMEMPKESRLTLQISANGAVYVVNSCSITAEMYMTDAVPVPPHGELIDRAELWVEINKICDRRDAGIITDLTCLQQILSTLRHAPTIIPTADMKEES